MYQDHSEFLSQFCAPNVRTSHSYISVNPNISLRLFTFQSAQKSENPPLLFVAGWVSMIEAWQEVLIEITRDFNVYYLETREKISSRVNGKVSYSVEAIGDDLIAAVKQFQFVENNYLMFGSSLGATAILDCYRKLSATPRALILVGPNAEFRIPKTWYYIVKFFHPPLYELIKPSVKWYLRTFRLDLKSDAEQYEKYSRAIDAGDPWKLKKAVLALSSYEIWPRLSEITKPVLIIGASKDKLHEPENLKKMVNQLPQSDYIDLETNKKTHSAEMVIHLRKFVTQLQ